MSQRKIQMSEVDIILTQTHPYVATLPYVNDMVYDYDETKPLISFSEFLTTALQDGTRVPAST